MFYDLNQLAPAKEFNVPNYPTLEQARGDVLLLKKLPSRWQKNATVIACAGMLAMSALTGCAPRNDHTSIDPENTPIYWSGNPAYLDTEIRVHHGGGGGGPYYVVYLTEQEFTGFLRSMLEDAGLNLSTTPPSNAVHVGWTIDGEANLGIDFFDAERAVAISILGSEFAHMNFMPSARQLAEDAQNEFNAQGNDFYTHVFFNGGAYAGSGVNEWWDDMPEEWLATPESKLEAAAAAKQCLIDQVNAFVATLRERGVLDTVPPTQPPSEEMVAWGLEDVNVHHRMHFGGAGGGAASYLVHLTEQEFIGFLHTSLIEKNMTTILNPGYSVNVVVRGELRTVQLTLLNAENRTGIIYLDMDVWGDWEGLASFEAIHNNFMWQYGITTKITFGQGVHLQRSWDSPISIDDFNISDEQILEVLPELREMNIKYAQYIAAFLRDEKEA